MKNINKISYLEIKNILVSNNINPVSSLTDNELFLSFNSLSNATQKELTFFHENGQIHALKKTKAKACLINSKYQKYLPNSTIPILVDNTYNSFAILTSLFALKPKSNGIISELSSINKNSTLDLNVQIDQFVEIAENCKIDKNVIIHSNCKIGPNVIIGENSVVHSNSSIQDCKIGSNCIIKSGAVIGGTGFGFDPKSKKRIVHIGNVVIGNGCNIGSNTTVDKAVFDSTIISDNCFIDNLVQIAHNVTIGEGGIIAAQTGIAGSTNIGDHVVIGGQVGIAGHITIGKNVKIAAKSGVTKNILDNSVVAGFPAVDIKRWKISNIKLNKLS